MNNIYAHPAMCSDAHTIAALQERLGMRVVVEGRRVRLVGEPKPTGRPMPDAQISSTALSVVRWRS